MLVGILSPHVSPRDLRRAATIPLPLPCRIIMTCAPWNGPTAPSTSFKMGNPTGNSLRQHVGLPRNIRAFATYPCHPSCTVPIAPYPPRRVTWYVAVSMKRSLRLVKTVKYWPAIVMETWNPSALQPPSLHPLLHRRHQLPYRQHPLLYRRQRPPH